MCSLREAINNSNADSDTSGGDCTAGSGGDTIAFNIAGGGALATISLSSGLPDVTDTVTINGNTQGCETPPCVELDGGATAFGTSGLNLTAGGSTVRGLAIHSFRGSGVRITSDGNFIEGNILGLDPTGTIPMGNFVGIEILGAVDNVIGGSVEAARNLTSANDDGIRIADPGATGNRVLGNYSGPDITGTMDFGTAQVNGIIIEDDAGNNMIGDVIPGARNLFTGNAGQNVVVAFGAVGALIVNNTIGTDVTGTLRLDGGQGILLFDTTPATDVTIGGTAVGAGNLISDMRGFRGLELGSSTGTVVQGNLIGTDITGTAALPNGIAVRSFGTDLLIGGITASARNVISANQEGIVLGASELPAGEIMGNYIGTDITGTAPLGNTFNGIRLRDGRRECIVGGTEPGARNVISGNATNGVRIEDAGTRDNLVLGNYIGVDVSGAVALPNGGSGVSIGESATDNTVGGTDPGAGNVIAASGAEGVLIAGSTTTGNTVQGNRIGTDVGGRRPLGNTTSGVRLEDTVGNTIGGTDPAAGNLIAASGLHGVEVRGNSRLNVIQGNQIGTDLAATPGLGNAGKGVLIDKTGLGLSNSNEVGGTAPGAANRIAGNGEEGIAVTGSSTNNPIRRNSIVDNALLGIDLGADGVTPNDPGDGDGGPNASQNYPVLASAAATTTDVTIAGSLQSTAGQTFQVELFAGPSCDASGHGEGERFLGAVEVTTDALGNIPFNVVLDSAIGNGEAVTATATSAAGDTSEFSACVAGSCSQTAVFGPTILATDADAFGWGAPASVRVAVGDLQDVATYATLATYPLTGAGGFEAPREPSAGEGIYYLVRPLACGSWQTPAAAEPERDVDLP